MRFLTSTLTHRGGRDSNQDACRHWVNERSGCWTLADGLGGHGGGAEASQLAADAVLRAFQSHAECSQPALLTYIEFARTAVIAKQAESAELAGMRTTLVVLVSDLRTALWGHVGDSRLYFFRQGKLERQTLDHSVPQAMVEAGELKPAAIRFHEDRNRLLRSIGGREEVRATIEETPQRVSPGDAFLLASDGFWEHVYETEMELDLAKSLSPEAWLEHMRLRLRARAAPESDNYSAIAVMAVD